MWHTNVPTKNVSGIITFDTDVESHKAECNKHYESVVITLASHHCLSTNTTV